MQRGHDAFGLGVGLLDLPVAHLRAGAVRRQHKNDGVAGGDQLAESRLPFFALADRMLVYLDRVSLVLKAEFQFVGERLVDARIRNEYLELPWLALPRH